MNRLPARGVATVEFAIAIPLLLFLMLAVTELGRAFVQYTVLANSARNATRYLAGKAIFGGTGTVLITGPLRTETQNLVVYGNADGTGLPKLPALSTTQVTVTDEGTGDVSLTVLYPYQPLFAGGIPTFGLSSTPADVTFNMRLVVTMRAL